LGTPRRTVRNFFSDPADAALRYGIAYAVIGCLWVVSSDRLLDFLFNDSAALARFESIKGVLFVGATALLIFTLLRRKTFARFDDAGQGKLAFTARRTTSRTTLLSVLIFLLMVSGAGFALYQSARKEVTRNADDNLRSIAKLKVQQIESWLEEGRNDTELSIKSPLLVAELQAWLQGGKRHDAHRENLLTHLRQLMAMGHFRDVSLRDPMDGSPLLTLGDEAETSRISALTVAAARVAGPVLDDFQVADEGEKMAVSLRLLSPIRVANNRDPLALILVLQAPEKLLYPLLQEWPGSSRSAETLLMRGEGKDVLYLNTLRHHTADPLSLRLPLTTPDLIGAKVVGGQRGELRGVDYRQEPVLAYALPVAGTSWFVVAKIDEGEVYATLNMLTAISASMLAVLLALGGWGVAERHRRIESRHRVDQERFLLSRRIEILVRHANDCILLLGAGNRIIEVNDRCLLTYGYTREEMLALTADDLLADEERQQPPAQLPILGARGQLLYETRHRRKNGNSFPVEISKVVMNVEGRNWTQAIIRDISERKAHEARILQLSRLSATLSVLNHATARGASLEEVLSISCRACVEHGGFKLAWVGLADREAERIPVSFAYGEGQGHLKELDISTNAVMPTGRGPSAIAFREQRTYVCNDFANDPITLPWRDHAARYGIGAAIALPISCDGVPAGVLTAYSEKPNFFDAPAEHLLEEIAESLSFAMHHFAEQAAKREMDTALRKSEEQLQEAQAIAKLGHWEYDLETGASSWSPQMYRLFERDPACGPADARDVSAYYTPESASLSLACIRQAIISGQRVELEQQLTLRGQRTAYHASVLIPLRNERGRTIALHGTVQDITEHKLSEIRLSQLAERLRQYAKEVEDLYENAPCGYHSLDKDGVFQRINETELKWLGYARAEVVGKMKYSDLLSPSFIPSFHHNFPRIQETGELHNLEHELVCKNGAMLPVLVSATSIRDQEGRFLLSRSTMFNMTEHKKMEDDRRDYARRLADLSRRLVAVQEEGRRQLSASLHDRTSPNLAAIGINLRLISKAFSPELSPELTELLADIRALLEDTTASIREISADLRPPLLDYAGLLPALEGYAHQFTKRTGTAVRVSCAKGSHAATRLTPDIESLLFRITQEALTNCAKHACATEIEVVLKHDCDKTVLTIADNGIGFEPNLLGQAGTNVGLGVLNMREMTEFAGGRFTLDARPGEGTSIRVEIERSDSLVPAAQSSWKCQ